MLPSSMQWTFENLGRDRCSFKSKSNVGRVLQILLIDCLRLKQIPWFIVKQTTICINEIYRGVLEFFRLVSI